MTVSTAMLLVGRGWDKTGDARSTWTIFSRTAKQEQERGRDEHGETEEEGSAKQGMAWHGREGKVKDAAGEDAASRCRLSWAWSSARDGEAAGGSGVVIVVVVMVVVRARADGTAVVVPQGCRNKGRESQTRAMRAATADLARRRGPSSWIG
jgi:hypothetical protein